MIPISQVARGIFRIGPLDTGHPSASTAPFVVVGDQRAAVVEPGEDGQVAPLVEAIKILGVDLDRVAYVIASHIHLHHIQGVPLLLTKLPQAKFVVHQAGAPHVIEPTRLVESTQMVWGAKCYGPMAAVPRERVIAAADGQVFDLGGRQLETIYAPGHAPHHMFIFDRLTRALFVGDHIGVHNPGRERGRPDILPPIFDVEKWADSVHRAQALNPSVLLAFGYGGGSYNPENTLRWAEEDIRAIERICLEGMRQKATFAEIGRRVDEHYTSVGIGQSAELSGAPIQAAPFGLIAYLKKKYPELEMPAGASPKSPRAP